MGDPGHPVIDEELFSLLVHELKTPLTPLKTVAQLIRSRVAKARLGTKPLDMDALERNVATIERQVDRMDRMVTDLLEVSRIGRGRFELHPETFDLARSVRDVAARWIDATEEEGRHRIAVDAPASLTVLGDQARIEQVVSNLISNAVKFSPRGGDVRVTLSTAGKEAEVGVRDQGIGIERDDIPAVGVVPFKRSQRTSSYAGVGVALYLSRIIAQGHGGRVLVDSDGPDKGTTAKLILPL